MIVTLVSSIGTHYVEREELNDESVNVVANPDNENAFLSALFAPEDRLVWVCDHASWDPCSNKDHYDSLSTQECAYAKLTELGS